jgi:glycosyltransferase involved in cell wall biosynthesis
MDNKKVIIVCYTFPPSPGIGGRRWVKFAKYFKAKGIDVKIICAKSENKNDVSQWCSDLDTLHNDIIYQDTNAPYYIANKSPKTFFGKILYRWHHLKDLIKHKGYIYDSSLNWKPILQSKIVELYKQGYNNVIVTGGPFESCVQVAELKKTWPQLNVIVDFRDFWTTNETSFSYKYLTDKRMFTEKLKEKFIVENVDYVVSVYDELTDYFKQKVNRKDLKFLTIPNGFDELDFQALESVNEFSVANLNVVFTGTYYDTAFDLFKSFIMEFTNLKNNNFDVFERIHFHFYGYVPSSVKNIVNELSIKNIHFYGTIPLNEVYSKIKYADACCVFLTDDYSFSFSTKFYEYLSQKKPILVFSNGGIAGEFVEQKKIGFNLVAGNIENGLLKIYEEKESMRFNEDFDISSYNISNLADRFIEILK